MRTFDRDSHQIRPYCLETGFIPWAAGSVLVSCGNTSVLCNASFSEKLPDHCKTQNRGWITAEYAMLPHSGYHRSPRDGRPDVKGRTYEIQRLIGRSVRAGINLEALGPLSIMLDCDVLKADGGTRTAAISGSWVALIIALNSKFSGHIPAQILRSPCVAAISAGLVNGKAFLDLDYKEDSVAEVDLNLVGDSDGRIIEIQATSEATPKAMDVFLGLLEIARTGLESVFNEQRESLRKLGIEL